MGVTQKFGSRSMLAIRIDEAAQRSKRHKKINFIPMITDDYGMNRRVVGLVANPSELTVIILIESSLEIVARKL